ncbi:MAG: anthranilate phosphoribosyltransferase [bacterium]|nr:anthranilate phosphoribosyltransferase [bacterium]MDT8365418.1 anthranilate phosphoribosyltransferase [bacterium]
MGDKEARWREFGAIVVKLIHGQDLTREEAYECWKQVCEEAQSDLQQGAFIAALKAKGETPEEVAGTFEALYEYDTIKVKVNTPEPLIDNCGTGADTLKTLNISTGAAIIAASLGLYVVRHAARAISSNCGSVDVVEAFGVNVESAPNLPKKSIENAGICIWNAFLTSVHPKTLGRVLSQIRFGSAINLVGPLLNPTMPEYKVMGVPNREMIDIEVRTLKELGFKRAFVMHGLDDNSEQGMDEVSTLGVTHIAELKDDGFIENYEITPDDFGIKRGTFAEIASTKVVQLDAMKLLKVLAGKDTGPRSDIICLNTAPLLYVMGKAKDLKQGVEMARQAIADGKPVDKLRDWVTWQNDKPEDGIPTLEKMISQL